MPTFACLCLSLLTLSTFVYFFLPLANFAYLCLPLVNFVYLCLLCPFFAVILEWIHYILVFHNISFSFYFQDMFFQCIGGAYYIIPRFMFALETKSRLSYFRQGCKIFETSFIILITHFTSSFTCCALQETCCKTLCKQVC